MMWPDTAGFFTWLTQEIVSEADADAGKGFDDPSSADTLRLRRARSSSTRCRKRSAGFAGALRAIASGARSAPSPESGFTHWCP